MFAVLGIWSLSIYGPPAVDHYFLPTIEFIAGSVHALAPQPPPATRYVHAQSPIPAGFTSTVFNTAFAEQTGSETKTMPFTIYGHPSQTWSQKTHSDPLHPRTGAFGIFSSFFDWSYRTIYEATHATLLRLRKLLDNFIYQIELFTAIFVSYQLLKYRSECTMKTTALQNQEMMCAQEELSLLGMNKDSEIASLKTQQQSQKLREEYLLEEARKETKARNSAEEQFKKEITEFSSKLTDKDNELAERDLSVAQATKRAETAENSNTILEKKAKTSRSDFDSHSQKKENEIEKLTQASQKAAKEEEDASRELKEARAQAGKEKKKITELEKQVTESKKKTVELEAQIKENEASLSRKDQVLKEKSDAKTKDAKLINELRAQLSKAQSLCQIAEQKASNQEASVHRVVDQRRTTEAKAPEQEALATKARKARTSEAHERQMAAEDHIETLKGEIATLLEQNNLLRAASSGDKENLKTESQEGEREDEDAVNEAPLTTRSDSEKLPYKPTRVRCNRRRDGTIRTATHPLSTPSKQPGTGEQRPIDEHGALDGRQTSEGRVDVGSSNPKQVRRVCPYFPQGKCKFGDACFDAHELPSSPKNPSEPSVQAPKPALVPQANDHRSHPKSSSKPGRPICIFFQQGNCRFGAKCRDSHDLSRR